MDCRTLLEKAAKAAGFKNPFWNGGEMEYTHPEEGHQVFWRPLTDDGDALRLAVKMRINIEFMKTLSGKDFGINCWPIGRGDCGASEDTNIVDYAAATRRAIVRAAAAMADKGE